MNKFEFFPGIILVKGRIMPKDFFFFSKQREEMSTRKLQITVSIISLPELYAHLLIRGGGGVLCMYTVSMHTGYS